MRVAVLAALTVIATVITVAPASAATIAIGFESDPLFAHVPEPFTSADSSDVHFSDSVGNNLFIASNPGGGRALAILFVDSSALQIEFDFLANAISLDVANGSSAPSTQKAVLTAFLNGTVVGSSQLGLNGNGLIDQSISLGGLVFDSVTLAFAMPTTGDKLVDNILISAVPEPSAALVFGTGMAIFGAAIRRPARAKCWWAERLR